MMGYLIHWVLASLLLMVTAYVVPGMRIKSFMAGLFAALMVGLVNVLVWPILLVLTLPITVITFGLFLFVINGVALKMSAALSPGFEIKGLMPAIWGSIVLTVLGWLIRFVFMPA